MIGHLKNKSGLPQLLLVMCLMVLWFDGLIRLSPCQLFKLLDAPHTPFSFSLDQQFWMV